MTETDSRSEKVSSSIVVAKRLTVESSFEGEARWAGVLLRE